MDIATSSLALVSDDPPSPLQLRRAVAIAIKAAACQHFEAQHQAEPRPDAGSTKRRGRDPCKRPSVATTGFPDDVPPCGIMSALALATCAALHSHGTENFVTIHGRAVCGMIATDPVLRDGVVEILLEDASQAAVVLRGRVPDGTLLVRVLHWHSCVVVSSRDHDGVLLLHIACIGTLIYRH